QTAQHRRVSAHVSPQFPTVGGVAVAREHGAQELGGTVGRREAGKNEHRMSVSLSDEAHEGRRRQEGAVLPNRQWFERQPLVRRGPYWTPPRHGLSVRRVDYECTISRSESRH